MHYNNEQFNALAPYEDNFRTATEGKWTRRVSIPAQKQIRAIYTEATGERIPFNIGCGSCIVNLLRKAGKLYFEDKAARAAAEEEAKRAQEAAPAPAEEAQTEAPAPKPAPKKKSTKSAKK